MMEIRKGVQISIIVPVYNGGEFLLQFLDCLQKQTMRDFEVIFVDDCSIDDTPSILQKALCQGGKMRYYRNEERQGAALSRNKGIEYSKALYILCLDADDIFEADLLEEVYHAAVVHDADMVMLERGDFYGMDASARCRKKDCTADCQEVCMDKVFSVEHQPIDFLLRCQNGTCDRLIKRELLEEYNIRFQNISSSNDVFYVLCATFLAERIVHTKTFDNLYHRRVHSKPGRISNNRDAMNAVRALEAVQKKLKSADIWEKVCEHFWVYALDSLERQLFACKDEDRQRIVYRYLQEEGLRKLGIGSDGCYNRLPEDYRIQFSRFLTEPYENRCFQESMTLQAVCSLKREKIAVLIDYMENIKGDTAIWGVGRMTKVFLDYVKKNGGKIEYIIDNDNAKHGKKVGTAEVYGFDALRDKVGFVIIANRIYYMQILAQIKKQREEIKLLSLEEYLYSKGELQNYVR